MRNVLLIALFYPFFGISQQYFDSIGESNYSVEIGFVKPDYSGSFRLNNAYIAVSKNLLKGSYNAIYRLGYQRSKAYGFFEKYDKHKPSIYFEYFFNTGVLINLFNKSRNIGLYTGVEGFFFKRRDIPSGRINGAFVLYYQSFFGGQIPLQLEFFQRKKISFSIEAAIGYGVEDL